MRGKLVAQIALEDSVFDEHGFLRRLAFIVDVERAATPGHGAVIDYRTFFAGYALADQSSESRRFLAVEVGFEAMAYGFVQKDAGPTGTEDNFHVARRSFAGIELKMAWRAASLAKNSGVFSPKKKSSATRPPPPEVPRPELASVLAIQETFMRASGCESSANVPSEPTMRMLRSSSA